MQFGGKIAGSLFVIPGVEGDIFKHAFVMLRSALSSRAICRLSVSLVGAAMVGILPALPAATPSPVHLSTTLAAGGAWLNQFNTWRANSGQSALTENPAFSAGDAQHALYMVQTGDVAHSENPIYSQYSAAGNIAAQNSNIVVNSSTGMSDAQAIDWWMGAPFHAMAMMDPRLATTGFGSYRNSAYTWATGAALNVGQGMTGSGSYPVYFPGNLSTEPLTTYSGNEFPNPQGACPGYTGLPLFVEIGANVNTAAGAATLLGNGTPLTACVIDSTIPAYTNYMKWRGGVIVFPQQPLQNGVTYTVAITVNSVPYTWSFTVGAFATCTLGLGGTPTVTSVIPRGGPVSGGTSVTINGCGFGGASAVSFGGTAASSFAVLSDSQVTAVSPAHAAGTVDVNVTNAVGISAASAGDRFQFQPPSVYTAVTPVRLLDTRNTGQTLGNGVSLNLAVGGIGSVPANATAIVLNVTAVNQTTAGAFIVYPTGVARPNASNLNWVAHQTVPNLVSVGLGIGGQVTIYNGAGVADAVVDLQGYYAPSGGGTAGQYVPVVPARITDTRPGSGQINAGATLGPNAILDVQVTGAGLIPPTGVTAIVMNVTATNTTAAGFFTAYPTGAALPLASNLNWTPGVTVPNRVIVPVGAGGKVSFHNGAGRADLIVDVDGYFTDSSGIGASFTALTPTRIVDTRYGTGGFISPLGPGGSMVVTVAGNGGVPGTASSTPPKAVVLNITVEGATAASDLVVWPDGGSVPLASDLNFSRGQTVPNLVIVKLSATGKIDIRNSFGSTSVIVDVVGWFG